MGYRLGKISHTLRTGVRVIPNFVPLTTHLKLIVSFNVNNGERCLLIPAACKAHLIIFILKMGYISSKLLLLLLLLLLQVRPENNIIIIIS